MKKAAASLALFLIAAAAFYAGRRFPRPAPPREPEPSSGVPARADAGKRHPEKSAPATPVPLFRERGPATENTVSATPTDNANPAFSAPTGNESEETGESPEDDSDGEEEEAGASMAGTVRLPGTDGEKIAALRALAAFRSSQSGSDSHDVPAALKNYLDANSADGEHEATGEPDDEDDPQPEEDPEDDVFRRTVDFMTLALEDPSSDVRDAAFGTLAELPDEEREVLCLQIMGNDDAYLKVELVKSATEAKDEFSVTLLMQALDSGDGEAADLAAKRLEELFGERFESAETALDWWEDNRDGFAFPGSELEAVPPDDEADATEAVR